MPPRALARALLAARRCSQSCAPAPPPPCPPCASPPPPPCRAQPARRVRAVRLTCCPPPPRAPPPCAAPPPACALTCADAALHRHASAASPPEKQAYPEECGSMRTKVSARLAAARLQRQRDYEAEAAARRSERAPAAPAPAYSLSGERECVCATDGKQYEVRSCRAPPPRPCGPCRAPPPPRCLDLVPDNDCQIRDSVHAVDPCAHRPRILIDIDRSGAADAASAAPPPPSTDRTAPRSDRGCEFPARSSTASAPKVPSSSTDRFKASQPSGSAAGASKERGVSSTVSAQTPRSPCMPKSSAARSEAQGRRPGRSITSRIMQCLSSGSGAAPQKIRRPSSEAKCPAPQPGVARRAGDVSWCATLKKPPAGAQPCRAPTMAEKLRRRTRPPCVSPKRRLHVSAASLARPASEKKDMASIVADTKAKADKLATVLKERSNLKDAAIGRRSGTRECSPPRVPPPPVRGHVDLEVPPCAGGVRVTVLVEEQRLQQRPPCDAPCAPGAGAKPDGKAASPCKPVAVPPTIKSKCDAATVQKSQSSPCAPNLVKAQKSDSWLSVKSLCGALSGRRGAFTGGSGGRSDKSCGKRTDAADPCAKTAKISDTTSNRCAQNKITSDPCTKQKKDPCEFVSKSKSNPCTEKTSSTNPRTEGKKDPCKNEASGKDEKNKKASIKVRPTRSPAAGVQSPCEAGRAGPCGGAAAGRVTPRDPCRRPPAGAPPAPSPNATVKPECNNKPTRFSFMSIFPYTVFSGS